MFQSSFDHNSKKRFTVKIGQHLKVISIDEIECFFSENKGTYIHTFDNRNYLIDATLEVLEQELEAKDFFRINRKIIIHLNSIEKATAYFNSRLIITTQLIDSDSKIVSRERVSEFKKWLDN